MNPSITLKVRKLQILPPFKTPSSFLNVLRYCRFFLFPFNDISNHTKTAAGALKYDISVEVNKREKSFFYDKFLKIYSANYYLRKHW